MNDQHGERGRRYAGWRADNEAGSSPNRESRRGLESFLGERYARTWEWRDSLGCLWIPGLIVILSILIWLGDKGIAGIALLLLAGVAIIGLFAAFSLIARSGRN